MVRKIHKVDWLEAVYELTAEQYSVLRANSKCDESADISEHRIAHILLKLAEVLTYGCKTQA